MAGLWSRWFGRPDEPPRALVPFLDEDEGAWGYMDDCGRVRIAPRFDQAGPFSEGRAQVSRRTERRGGPEAGAVMLIDLAGRVVLETAGQWQPDAVLRDGRIALWELREERWSFGVFDGEGRRVFSYDGPRPLFSEGLAPLCDGGRTGFVDRDGHVVIPPKFGLASEFSEGLAAVDEPSGTSPSGGYVDRGGEFVFGRRFTAPRPFSEGLAHVGEGFIDRSGALVFSTPREWRPGRFSEGLALVEDWSSGDRRFGFLGRDGAWRIAPRFKLAEPFSEGKAAAALDGKLGYLDQDGAWAIRPAFSRAGPFCGGVARVAQVLEGSGQRCSARVGYVDARGRWLRDWREDWVYARL